MARLRFNHASLKSLFFLPDVSIEPEYRIDYGRDVLFPLRARVPGPHSAFYFSGGRTLQNPKDHTQSDCRPAFSLVVRLQYHPIFIFYSIILSIRTRITRSWNRSAGVTHDAFN